MGCPVVRNSLMDRYMEKDPLLNEAIAYTMGVGRALPKVEWGVLYGGKYLMNTMIQEAYFSDKPAREIVNDAWDSFIAEYKR